MNNIYKAPITFPQIRKLALLLADWEWVETENCYYVAVNTNTRQVMTCEFEPDYQAIPATVATFSELMALLQKYPTQSLPFSQIRSLYDTIQLSQGQIYDIVAWHYSLDGIKFDVDVGGKVKTYAPELFVPIFD